MTSHQVKVGIYNPTTGKSIYLNAGDPTDRYFTNISWAPDEKSLYLIELNRDQNHAKLCRYDVETGELTATLFEEKSDKYVEPQDPIIFLPWDNSKFIYQSQRWLQPPLPVRYERPANPSVDRGRLAGKRGSGLRHQEKEIIIASTEFSPLQNNLFRLDTKTGTHLPWAVQKAYTAAS